MPMHKPVTIELIRNKQSEPGKLAYSPQQQIASIRRNNANY